MIAALEVIRIHHDLIRPPGPKMVVCVCPAHGLFMNINTKGVRPGSVPISKRAHPFLDWDSHIECGKVYEFDDYIVGAALSSRPGVIGCVSRDVVPAIVGKVVASINITERDKQAIRAALETP